LIRPSTGCGSWEEGGRIVSSTSMIASSKIRRGRGKHFDHHRVEGAAAILNHERKGKQTEKRGSQSYPCGFSDKLRRKKKDSHPKKERKKKIKGEELSMNGEGRGTFLPSSGREKRRTGKRGSDFYPFFHTRRKKKAPALSRFLIKRRRGKTKAVTTGEEKED